MSDNFWFRIKTNNLDLHPAEVWPKTTRSSIPRVGDFIQSAHEWPKHARVTLKVVSITWEPRKPWDGSNHHIWGPVLELATEGSIAAFHEWYRKVQQPPDPE